MPKGRREDVRQFNHGKDNLSRVVHHIQDVGKKRSEKQTEPVSLRGRLTKQKRLQNRLQNTPENQIERPYLNRTSDQLSSPRKTAITEQSTHRRTHQTRQNGLGRHSIARPDNHHYRPVTLHAKKGTPEET